MFYSPTQNDSFHQLPALQQQYIDEFEHLRLPVTFLNISRMLFVIRKVMRHVNVRIRQCIAVAEQVIDGRKHFVLVSKTHTYKNIALSSGKEMYDGYRICSSLYSIFGFCFHHINH